jgi:hypothetical protein
MKTKIPIHNTAFVALVYLFVTCSKEASYPLHPYPDQVIKVPKMVVQDTIFTNFFTPGQTNLAYAIDWGGETGKLSIINPSTGITLDSLNQVLLWDDSLPLGIYPIILQAENSVGLVKDTIFIKTLFGGYFKKLRNDNPNSLEGLVTERPLIFNYDGYVHSCECIDTDYGWLGFTPGQWRWISENEIRGTYDNEENDPERVSDSKRAFKVTVTYDADTGYPRLTGVWYQDAIVVPGAEKGSIMLSMDISAWDYFHTANK